MKVISGPRYFKMFFSETNPYCPFESVHPHQRCVGVTEQVYFLVALRVKSEEFTYIWLWECLISDDWRGERCLLWLLRMCHSQYNDLMIRCEPHRAVLCVVQSSHIKHRLGYLGQFAINGQTSLSVIALSRLGLQDTTLSVFILKRSFPGYFSAGISSSFPILI